jgi:hypothetical protein
MKMITVNVFNMSHVDNDNYITSIEMPEYKYFRATLNHLRDYVKKQNANDFNHKKMRFYVFESNTFVLTESELDIKN